MSEAVAVTRLAVVENGRIVEEQGARHPIPWWSFTKTVIAAAALVLVRDGVLALDQPLADEGWTLRQLLQHRAGLPDYGDLPAYHQAVADGAKPWPAELLMAQVEAKQTRSAPGTDWSYSNIGYWHARRLIETTTGETLSGSLHHLVTRPLDVLGPIVAQGPEDLVGVDMGEVAGYHPGWVYHGLLVGTSADAAMLLHRLMHGKLLPPNLLAAMQQAYRLPGPAPGRPWAEPGYGLGLMLGSTSSGGTALGHTGSGPGSVCAVYHCPATGRTAAAFAPGRDQARVEEAAFRLAAGRF